MDFNILNNQAEYKLNADNIQKSRNVNNSNVFSTFNKITPLDTYSFSTNNKSELTKSFEKIKKQQGIIGKAWDGIKNIFGMKSGSKYVEKIIKQAEKGEITQEEAQKALDKYKEGQKTCVDVVADIASGILAVGAFALAVPTGGASLAVGLAAATAIGAGTKIGIKGIDAAVTGKEYKGKDLLYDFATGAINGLMAPVTNGLGNCVTKTIGKKLGLEIIEEGAEQAVKQTAKSVILTKAVDVAGGNIAKRAISLGAGMAVDGALGGASDNMVRAALNGENVAKAGIQGAIGGFIMSPIIGGGFRVAGKTASKLTKKFSQNVPDGSAAGAGAKAGADALDGSPAGTKASAEIADAASDSSTKAGAEIADTASDSGTKAGAEIADTASDSSTKTGAEIADTASDSGAKMGDDSVDSAAGKKPKTDDVTSSAKKQGIYDSPDYNKGVGAKIKELRASAKGNTEIKEFKIKGKKVKFEVFLNTQSGSNTGYYAINQSTGELFYAKIGGSQSGTEILASKIYKAAGIDVPELSHFVSPTGEQGVLSKYIPNLTPITTSNSSLYDGFAMDALLANWDAVCSNNAVSDGVNAIRIDLGGTFDYRAQGAKKSFTSMVEEISTLVNPSKNHTSANIFAGMTRDDLIASLQKVADLDDNVLKKLLKDEGLEKYTEVLLKRKEFLTDLLTIAKNTPDNGGDILKYINKVKNQTFDISITKAKTLQDISDIQTSISHVQDISYKKQLQDKLDQKKIAITKSIIKPHKAITQNYFEDLLKKSGFVKNAQGEYTIAITQEFEDNVVSKYGPSQASIILQKIKKPIKPYEINDILKLMNVSNGKYIDYFSENMIDFITYYRVIRHGSLFSNFDNISPSQWDAVFNTLKYKVPGDTVEALATYKGSSATINGALTTKRKVQQGLLSKDQLQYISKSTEQHIKDITDYIDTQAISEPMKVYRGEGFSVLDSVDIGGHKLSDLMKACGGDSQKVYHLIDMVEQGNYVATQERFMSTSLIQSSSFTDKPVIWDMDLPAGTKGVFLEGANINGCLTHECEYLIQRGFKIRIKKINYDFNTGKWYIKGEIIN